MDKKKEKIIEVAERVKLLFQFCAELIPDKELLKKTLEVCEDTQQMAGSTAVIIGACGGDYQALENQARLRKERAAALYNLIEVLEKTEKEQIEFAKKAKTKQANLRQLQGILGLT